jgi:Cu/Ag efflux protein CusF
LKEDNMRRLIATGTGIALLLLLAACAEKKPAGPLPSGTLAENTVTVTATVEKIDLKTRHVTLRGPDGKVNTLKVPEEVRNLPQVKVGDQVVATYYESLAFEVRKAGTAQPGVVAATDAARAEPGQRPGAAAANAVTVTATITDIDKKNGTVTITGPGGDSVTVKARNPANLDRISKGDLVDITYTEALAVSVSPVPKPGY